MPSMMDMSRITVIKRRSRQRSFLCVDLESESFNRECCPLGKGTGWRCKYISAAGPSQHAGEFGKSIWYTGLRGVSSDYFCGRFESSTDERSWLQKASMIGRCTNGLLCLERLWNQHNRWGSSHRNSFAYGWNTVISGATVGESRLCSIYVSFTPDHCTL